MSVTRNQILMALKQLNGAAFASIDTVTEVKLKGGKKNPMLGRVTKHCSGSNVLLSSNLSKSYYETMVQKRLVKEGQDPSQFELKPRTWGQRIPTTPFIHHVKDGKDEYYLEVIFRHPPKETVYKFDGELIDKKDIIGLDATKEESEQGGLEDKVIIRSYNLNSIKRVKCGNLSVETLPA